jgi:Fe-S-cluster-containing dehydrogenase component
MVINLAKCIGCQACTVACKFQNNVPDGQYRTQTPTSGLKGTYPNVSQYFIKEACQMCQNAPCVSVCPTHASHYNNDGVVLIDEDKCVGCKYCMTACPYNARFLNKATGIVDKCTFCYELRISKGEKPVCVSTCLGGALLFGDLNDTTSEVSQFLAKHKGDVRKPELGTHPNIYYIYEGVVK